MYIKISLVLALALVSGCDAVREAEKMNKKLVCNINEPFLFFTFNSDLSGTGAAPVGTGPVLVRFPDNSAQGFGTYTARRLPSSPAVSGAITTVVLNDGATSGSPGTILEIKDLQSRTIPVASRSTCDDDMAGPTNSRYAFTLKRYQNSTSLMGRRGCCILQP